LSYFIPPLYVFTYYINKIILFKKNLEKIGEKENHIINMVFYGDVVIFICDEEGTYITESGLNQGSGMSGLDEEN